MVRKLVLSLVAVLGAGAMFVSAQNRQVSGTVTGHDGRPIAGATVFVEGTTVGTTTNAAGEYTLKNIPADASLVFQFIGMQNQTIPVAGKTRVDVTLADDTIGMDAVVITATGMTRAEKTLGYAATTVRSEDISQGHSSSVMSGLTGKVAGVQISQAGGAGTSQKVIVRGYSSLTGSNQPLYVVDGVPVNNTYTGTPDDDALNNAADFGNQAGDVNPEDVESVTVLKGASATALYGSRAANGAILITTKKGKQNQEITVTYDGSFMGSSVLRVPQLQNRFGQGWGYDNDGGYFGDWASCENGSWGPHMDGRDHMWREGAWVMGQGDISTKPFSHAKNSVRDFYDIGFETNNNISVSGGNETTGFMLSYGNSYSNGVLPGDVDVFKRNTISLRGNTKIKGGLAWIDYSVNYVRKDMHNAMGGQGQDGSTIYQDILQIPADIDWADLKDYNSIYNNADNFYTPYAQNIWWTLDHNYATYQEDRVYGKVELGLQLYKGLKAIARIGGDFSNSTEVYHNDPWTFNSGSYAEMMGGSVEPGSHRETAYRRNQLDGTLLVNGDYTFGNFSVNATVGMNMNQRHSQYLEGSLSGLSLSNWPSFSNTSGATPTASTLMSRRRLVGVFGQADLGYKDFLYLTFSARNDWSSTLPIDDNSFFYWGVNASVIFTEMIPALKKNDILNFFKLRLAYGKTGNDAEPYYTSSYYLQASATTGFGSITFPLDGVAGAVKSTRIPSKSLQPEISTETEVGFDLRMFDNRFRVDFSWYDKNTKNQIMTATVAPESGFASQVRNIGKINNRGVELMVGVTPVRTKDFTWDLTYTFTKNKNKVKELWGDVNETLIYGLTSGPQLKAIVGESLGTWTFDAVETVTDEASPYFGKTIVNRLSGFPVMSTTEDVILGKADPDFTMGLNTRFRYKNLSLALGFDWRKGGKMYSATQSIAYFVGNAEETMYNDRNNFVVPNAVYVGSDGQYHENNIPVDARYGSMYAYYYSNYNAAMYERDLISKSFLKLREVNLTYSLPKKWFAKTKWLSGVDISFVGRNLLMWTKSQGLIDPEMTNYGNDLYSEYGEFYAAPTVRTFGGSIKVTF